MIKPLLACLVATVLATTALAAEPFQSWLETTVWPAARSAGVTRATFEAATAGLEPDLNLPDLKPTGGGEEEPVARHRVGNVRE